ncbi:glycosyltransferase [Echinicola sediminis]
MFFSIIIPVYNRPQELEELLSSLVRQSYKKFEVIVVEDGSSISSEELVKGYVKQIDVHYFYQENTGQGFARNFGMGKAKGDYFIFFDSDCIIPDDYLKTLFSAIRERRLDAHGGPDAAMEGFSDFQKAINYSMTSFWTTGGIRGKVSDLKKYQARGYNMGFSRKVYEKVGGFVDPNQGEDIELSIRIKKEGFELQLVKDAFVFHKRRNDFLSFLKQSFSFGANRVNVNRFHPGSIKPVHLMPLVFLLAFLGLIASYCLSQQLFNSGLIAFGFWTLAVFISATWANRSLKVGLMAIFTSYGQLFAYGAGLLTKMIRK